MIKVRCDLRLGQVGPESSFYPGQYGWWWMNYGYIARPGRPAKQFNGWFLGPAPQFYYPAGGGGLGVAGARGEFGGDMGEGALAPPAP